MSYPRSCRPFGVCAVEDDSALPNLTQCKLAQHPGFSVRGVAIRCRLRPSEEW
jgi:hypothetical protein